MINLILATLEHILLTLAVSVVIRTCIQDGWKELIRKILTILKEIPGFNSLLQYILHREASNFVRQMNEKDGGDKRAAVEMIKVPLPKKGISKQTLLNELKVLKSAEINPEDGKMFALVYTSHNDTFDIQKEAFETFTEKSGISLEHDEVVKVFHQAFMHENALNPMMFPSLRRFENEIISMTASILHGDSSVVGSLTSGGTESILMAVKTYRDRARKLFPHIKNPEIVSPITIHPAFNKAAHYFGLKLIHTPVDKCYMAVASNLEKVITPNTILLVASAPQYPHGVVDPIAEIGELALRRGLPLHVDACFGGFMLPWVEKLGYDVPCFDFRVDAVTSISADIHKYGYGIKGSSVILYKSAEIRKYQIFAYGGWPGGLFGSPSMAGTRPGGNIASSWVAMKILGEDGYMEMARLLMDVTGKLKEGIKNIEGLCIIGSPHMTAFAIGSTTEDVDILALADVMESKGWKMERQHCPPSLHCSILPSHIKIADELLKDLAAAVQVVKNDKTLRKKGTAAMYGMVGNIPDQTIVNDFIVEFFSEVYKL